MQRIISKDNSKIKRLKGLRQKKVRSSENLFLIEGTKAVMEALSMDLSIDIIAVSDTYLSNPVHTMDFNSKDIELISVPDDLFTRISSLVNPQGILASVVLPEYSIKDIIGLEKPLVLLDGIRDPGNLGTILRTADAFDFGGIVLTGACVDIYNPKCVQASMGSVLRVKSTTARPGDMEIFKDEGYNIIGLDLRGKTLSRNDSLPMKSIVCIGSESHGLADEIRVICDELIKIPMAGKAESLNAAIAAAIAMYMVE
jgi:TrmH family RNA methyltransferase